VCFEILAALTRLMAPILTFTADEVWSYIPGRGKPESVHLVLFPEERGEWTNERLAADWERLLEVRGEVSRALEVARQQGKIGKGVDAVVFVRSAPEEQWRPLLEAKGEALLTTLFNVSGTRLRDAAPAGAVRYESQDIPGLVLEIAPAQALGWKKCERCWTWSPRVGEQAAHPSLCDRCTPVVTALAR
jgi:isoleucyl-tRNA synthetase